MSNLNPATVALLQAQHNSAAAMQKAMRATFAKDLLISLMESIDQVGDQDDVDPETDMEEKCRLAVRFTDCLLAELAKQPGQERY